MPPLRRTEKLRPGQAMDMLFLFWVIAVVGGAFATVVGIRGFFQRIRDRSFEIDRKGSVLFITTNLASIELSREQVVVTSQGKTRQLALDDQPLVIDYSTDHSWAVFEESFLSNLSAIDTARPFRDVNVRGTLCFVREDQRIPFFSCIQYKPKWAFFAEYLAWEQKALGRFGGYQDVHDYVAGCVHRLMQAAASMGVEVKMVGVDDA